MIMNPLEKIVLLKKSDFGAVDILASCGVNGVATYLAVTHPSYRMSFGRRSDISFLEDVRFILGSCSLVYSQLYASELLRRPLQDLSFGLLSSFVSTEIVRQKSIARMKNIETVVSEGNIIIDEEEDLGSPSLNVWEPEENPNGEPLSYSYGY